MKLTIAAVLAVVLMFSGSVMAGGTSVYVGGGMSMPMSPDVFKDYYRIIDKHSDAEREARHRNKVYRKV